MAIELATAYVSLVPSAKGIQSKISEELGAPAEKAGKSAGGRITDMLGKTLKRGAIAVGVAVGGVLSTSLVKGWGRLTAIEDAKSKLDGLGHSAASVKTIMDNALGAVKGTAFGLDEAATVAASAVAAGIKPGQDLRRVLGLVGDTASIAGTSMGEMGAIFNKVAAANRLSLGEVNQLADRGVPILQMLAKQFGVTQGEMAKMVSAGKVDFPAFAKALETNIGGAALKSGDTTKGAFANMWAAAGRFSAALLEGVFPAAKIVFGGITRFADWATDAVKPLGEALGNLFLSNEGPVKQFAAGLTMSRDEAQALGSELQGFVAKGSAFRDFFDKSLAGVGDVFTNLRATAGNLAPAIGQIAGSLAAASAAIGISTWQILLTTVDALATVANVVLVPAIRALAGFMAAHQTTVTVLVGAYVTYRVAMLAVAAVTKTTAAVTGAYRAVVVGMTAASYGAAGATYAQGAALKVYNLITKATAIATRAWAATQWVLNAAMSANPIGLVVIAVAALVAGLVIAYKKSDTFRAIVDSAFRAVAQAAQWLWNNGIKPLWDGATAAFAAIGQAVSTVWSSVLSPVFSTAGRIIRSFAALWWWLAQQAITPVVNSVRTSIQFLGDVFSWLWSNAVKPAIDGIGALAKWLWSNAIKPAFDGIAAGAKWLWNNGIKPAFAGISTVISTAWNSVIKPTFDRVMTHVDRVRSVFKTAFGAIASIVRGAFNGTASIIRSALNSLISLVNRATSGINSMIGALNKVPGVDFPRIPRIPSLADGGIVPATPGGRIVRVAEAGRPEAIVPLDRLGRLPGSGPDVLELTLDLGEGIREVVRINLAEHDRQIRRRVLAGAGAR